MPLLWIILLSVSTSFAYVEEALETFPQPAILYRRVDERFNGFTRHMDHIRPRHQVRKPRAVTLEGEPKENFFDFDCHTSDKVETEGGLESVGPRPRVRRSVIEISQSTSSLSPVRELMRPVIRMLSTDKFLIILHDSHPDTLDDLDYLLHLDVGVPLILLDMTDPSLPESPWLGHYNDGYDNHVVFFHDAEVVQAFADALPDRVWTPSHLLLVNANLTSFAGFLLDNPRFGHSPFLTLLQRDMKEEEEAITRFQIFTHEPFRSENKVVTRGFFPLGGEVPFDDLFPDRFNSFFGYHFHLSSWVDDFPYTVTGETLEDTYGMCVYMLDDIAEKLNFTYQMYKEPEDHLWGDLVNGTWRGMIGEVVRGERDFCVNVMSLVEDRYQAVDFSVPYFLDSDSFVIRNPLPPPRWWNIVFPFSWYTWIGVLATLLLLPVLLSSLLKANGVRRNDLEVTFLEVTRIVLRQDYTQLPQIFSIRMFMGVWLYMAMIISISYTGNLIAYVTIPAKAQRIRTLDELAQSDIIPTMVDYGNFMPGLLRASEEKTLRTLGEKLELIPNYDYQHGFDMVNAGTHAFLEGTEYFRYMVILHKATNTYFLQEALFPSYVGWIYPKKTAWKHKFDKYLQRFVEAGLCFYWREKLAADFRREMNITEGEFETQGVRALSLVDLQGAFAVYGIFTILAMFVGVLEIVVCRPQRK